MKFLKPFSEQPKFDMENRVLSAHEREVDEFFSDKVKVEKLIRYLSMEERKGKDKFSPSKFSMFKALFQNHGSVHFDNFMPHLERLVSDKHESSQRCAAEIISALISGTRYWPYDMTASMFEKLIPVIRTALGNITDETVADWQECFKYGLYKIDPNRVHWVVECLMEESDLGNAETSFAECARYQCVRVVVALFNWRIAQLRKRIVIRLEKRLMENPLQIVRVNIGILLSYVFSINVSMSKLELEDLTLHCMRPFVKRILPKLSLLSEPDVNGNNIRLREEAISTLKVVCKWIACNCSGLITDHYQLFSIISQMENYDADEELVQICTVALNALAKSLTLQQQMDLVLPIILDTANSPSWSVRRNCLDFLQVHVFHNFGIYLNSQRIEAVRDVVLKLIEDERVEVREKSGLVLGGLLHCDYLSEPQELVVSEY